VYGREGEAMATGTEIVTAVWVVGGVDVKRVEDYIGWT